MLDVNQGGLGEKWASAYFVEFMKIRICIINLFDIECGGAKKLLWRFRFRGMGKSINSTAIQDSQRLYCFQHFVLHYNTVKHLI